MTGDEGRNRKRHDRGERKAGPAEAHVHEREMGRHDPDRPEAEQVRRPERRARPRVRSGAPVRARGASRTATRGRRPPRRAPPRSYAGRAPDARASTTIAAIAPRMRPISAPTRIELRRERAVDFTAAAGWI